MRGVEQRPLRRAGAAAAGDGAGGGAGPAQPGRARPVAAGGGQRVAETDEHGTPVGGVDKGQDVAGGDDDVEIARRVPPVFRRRRVRVGEHVRQPRQVADLPGAAGLHVAGDRDQVRVDVDADDVLAGLVGVLTVTPGQGDQARRLLDLLCDGLAAPRLRAGRSS